MKTITLPKGHKAFELVNTSNGEATLTIGTDIELWNITTKQKGYGRQGVYAELYIESGRDRIWVKDVYIMDVFPNINEHFNALPINDTFSDENNPEVYLDHNGNELDHVYSRIEDLFIGMDVELMIEEEEDEDEI